jgi:RND family efflux transporter MFP subunit
VNKCWWIVIVGIGLAAVLAWIVGRWIVAGNNTAAEPQQRVTVRVERPRIGTAERVLNTSGTLRAGGTINVTSEVAGQIEAILVEEGETVAEGDLLVQIEEQTPRLQVEQAYAAWQAAQAQYEKALRGPRTEELENARALYEKAQKDLVTAEESFIRSERLYDSGTIPKAQFEQTESSLRAARTELENAGRSLQMLEEGATEEEKRIARAQADAARASYELARVQLENTRIRAPGPAVVARILQDTGNIVGTSAPILVLVQDERIQVEIQLAEKYYGEIIGSSESLEARIVPQAYPGSDPFPGRIVTVAPTINPGSRTFTVTVDISDPQALLRPGMYAEVELVLKRISDALLVPASALLDRDGRQFVFVVEGSGENTFASALNVVTGLSGAAEVQILSGIDLKDRVVVEGNSFLEDGQPIGVLEQQ